MHVACLVALLHECFACLLHTCCIMHACCMYIAMLPSCCMHVCCMYIVCMLHVRCMYVACPVAYVLYRDARRRGCQVVGILPIRLRPTLLCFSATQPTVPTAGFRACDPHSAQHHSAMPVFFSRTSTNLPYFFSWGPVLLHHARFLFGPTLLCHTPWSSANTAHTMGRWRRFTVTHGAKRYCAITNFDHDCFAIAQASIRLCRDYIGHKALP